MYHVIVTPQTSPLHFRRGFTLIELLLVMAIITMIASLTVPAMRGILDGLNIAGAGDTVGAELALARQSAVSRNLPVEVRFYKDGTGNPGEYRSMSLVIPPSSTSAGNRVDRLTSLKSLPTGVGFDLTEPKFSTILSGATAADPTNPDQLGPISDTEPTDAPKQVAGKEYVAFTFRPDGTTNLDATTGNSWCLTVRKINDATGNSDRPANNFISIVVDPLSGKTLSFQP